MTNTGRPFEQLTRRVFDALLKQQAVVNLRLEHDVVLQGLTATHQIDVYWEFDAGGITYRTVVECKDWGNAVAQGTLFSLKAVLDDLPGQPRGVVVSRSGFQEGARRFAEAHGILLYELRPPRATDWNEWDGFITSVNITAQLLAPKLHAIEFKVHPDWVSGELSPSGVELAALPPLSGVAGQMILQRDDGSAIRSVADLIERDLSPHVVCPPEWREHAFTEATFIASAHPLVRRIRLRAIRARVEVVVAFEQNIAVNLETMTSLILKDVLGHRSRLLDAEGIPLGASE